MEEYLLHRFVQARANAELIQDGHMTDFRRNMGPGTTSAASLYWYSIGPRPSGSIFRLG